MKRINLLVALALAAIIINGCSADEADRYASKNFAAVGGEEIVGEDFGSLALLLGNPTKQDMLNVAGDALGRLNMMAEIGKYNPAYPELSADYQNVIDMMGRAHDMMVEKQIIYYEELAAEARGEGEPEFTEKELEELTLNACCQLFGLDPKLWDADPSNLTEQPGTAKAWLGEKMLNEGAYDLASMIANIDNVDVYAMLEHLMLQDAETILYPAFTGIKIKGFPEGTDEEEKMRETIVQIVGLIHGLIPTLYNDMIPQMNNEKESSLSLAMELVKAEQVVELVGMVLGMLAGMEVDDKGAVGGLAGDIVELINGFTTELFIGIDLKALMPLVEALMAKNPDGTDSPFMHNIKVLLCEAIDVENELYNPDGAISKDANIRTLVDMLIYNPEMSSDVTKYMYNGNIYVKGDNVPGQIIPGIGAFLPRVGPKVEKVGEELKGDKGFFNFNYMLIGLYDLTDEKSVDNLWNAICWIVDPKCLVWELLGIDTTVKWPVQVSDILGMDPNECLVTLPFVQGMFTDYPGDGYEGSLVEWGMNGLDLDGKGFGQYGAMRTLMTNIVDLGSVDLGEAMGPDTEGYKFAMGMLEMVSKRARP